MAKVIIDAGHGGMEPGAIHEGRQEKDDTLRLALAVGDILRKNGVEVVFTRDSDVYISPAERAQIANQTGGDFLISIHRNSSPEPNQYSGVESLIFNRSGQKVQMAENINAALERAGFKNLGIRERPGLVILRRTRMPAVLVETGFINTEADNELFDRNFEEIAQAIADGILQTLHSAPPQNQQDNPSLYRVQTGAFRRRAYAEELLYRLQQQNFPAFLIYEEPFYRVQVGAFRVLDNAVRMEERLRQNGYSTFITTE